MYKQFLSQVSGGEVTLSFLKAIDVKYKINNPDCEKQLDHNEFRKAFLKTVADLQDIGFKGVCYLLDGADFIVGQDWANDVWSYLRGIKDTDTSIKPFLGLCFTGYRNLKEYQQAVGSPLLNIAEVLWLSNLTDLETLDLIKHRCEYEHASLTEEQKIRVVEWSGKHAYLIQQILNLIFDDLVNEKDRSHSSFINKLLRQHDQDFSAWWSNPERPYSFSDSERNVYQALIKCRQSSIEGLAKQTNLSFGQVMDSLEVLAGTGVIARKDEELYEIGAKLFEEWVAREKTPT
jgi:succinate dehydrogenase flavin-adding protein (antitoxin of CptAB toxin-antitoxin module)